MKYYNYILIASAIILVFLTISINTKKYTYSEWENDRGIVVERKSRKVDDCTKYKTVVQYKDYQMIATSKNIFEKYLMWHQVPIQKRYIYSFKTKEKIETQYRIREIE